MMNLIYFSNEMKVLNEQYFARKEIAITKSYVQELRCFGQQRTSHNNSLTHGQIDYFRTQSFWVEVGPRRGSYLDNPSRAQLSEHVNYQTETFLTTNTLQTLFPQA